MTINRVLAVPPAEPETAAIMFARQLALQTDVSDVQAALALPEPGFVLVDSRSAVAWDQGHIPGAVHLPTDRIPELARTVLPPGGPVVTYCWGPGCNGATRAALALARLGFPVKEMIGGYEYWVREGLPVRGRSGDRARPADPLAAPSCGC